MNVLVVGTGTLAHATCRGCWHAGFRADYLGRPDVVWVCEDVRVTETTADYSVVWETVARTIVWVPPTTPILISSQVPVGSLAKLEARHPNHVFAYCPENLRVATAEADFLNQSRMVIGRRTYRHDDLWRALCNPFTDRLILTDPETAELSKHALNGFLALQIAYANEIAAVAREVGADPDTLAEALLTEDRISPNAPLRPGAPFGGGHLARDCRVLESLSRGRYPLLDNILASNAVPK